MRPLFYFFLGLIFTSCTPSVPISGTLEIPEESNYKPTVYLIQPKRLDDVAASFFGKVIDSAAVKDDGSFAFKKKPTASAPMLLELAVQKKGNYDTKLITENATRSNYMPIVWEEGEHIGITATIENFQQSFKMEDPSVTNKELLNLRDVKLSAFQQYLQNKNWNVHEGSGLLEKETAFLNYQKQLIKFATHTKELFPALVAMRWANPQNDYERIPEFLFNQCKQWKAKAPNHPWVQQLCAKAAKDKLPILLGSTFPNATLPLVSGSRLKLNSVLAEKLTIVDLWASWCVPCRKENREFLAPLWEQFHKKGFQIIAYGLETNKEAWQAAIKKDGAYRWLQASHLQGDEAPLLKTLRIQTIPANYILDSQGKVIAKNLHGVTLKNFVEAYIASH